MAISLAQNPQMNHWIQDSFEEGLTPLQSLEQKISWLNTKSTAYNALEKICYVAILAIIGTVFWISYTSIALSGAASLGVVGLALSTPLFSSLAAKLNLLVKQIARELEFEGRVFDQFREIEEWQAPQIQQFFQDEAINPNLDPLRSIDPERPERALLPLIARYQHLKTIAHRSLEYYNQAPQRCVENLGGENNQIPVAAQQTIRFATHEIAQRVLESEGIPAAIFAATLLQIMEQPSTQIDYNLETQEIPGVGYCSPRVFRQRIFGRHIEPLNDDYFIFHQREALSLAQIQEIELNPAQIRPILFPA